MKTKSIFKVGAIAAALALSLPTVASDDPLNSAAVTSTLASNTLLLDIQNVGNKLVTVGERGHILISNNGGVDWQQANVPVRTTLTAVYFIDDQHGWAVGHEGVILHSQDGGKNWIKQLDGYQLNELEIAGTAAAFAVIEADEDFEFTGYDRDETLELAEYKVDDAYGFVEQGASRPFLNVWFTTPEHGYVAGSFGGLLETTDGGNNWRYASDRLDNPESYHVYGMSGAGDTLYLAGEAGSFYRSFDAGKNFELVETPYYGSFFGLNHEGDNVFIYGLQGRVYHSMDRGDTWNELESGGSAAVNGSLISSDGKFFVSNSGHITHKNINNNNRVQVVAWPVSAVTQYENELVMVGYAGVKRVSIEQVTGEKSQ